MASMLKEVANGRLIAADVTRSALLVKHDWYCVYPTISMVRNIGYDGTGEHCCFNKNYMNQEICEDKMIFDESIPLQFDASIQDWIHEYLGGWTAALKNKLIFFEQNAESEILRRLYRFVHKNIGLPRRIVRGLVR